MGDTVMRIGKSLFVHILIAVILIGTIWWMTSSFEDASQLLRDQYKDAADDGATVLGYVDQARGSLIEWCGISCVISFLFSSLFISLANNKHPRGYEEGGRMAPMWAGLFVATIAGVGILWWQYASFEAVGQWLVSANYLICVAATVAGILIAYFLATAVGVKLTMKRSVPLAELVIPDGWN